MMKKSEFIISMIRILRYLYFLFCKFFFKLYCPIKVYGRENLPEHSFILCSNHNSHIDTPVLMLATGIPFNQFSMVAAKDYFFDNRWRKMIGVIMNLIPLDRKASRSSLINYVSTCQHFVEQGCRHLIIYPEGTRSMTGELQPFKRGPAFIAQKLGIPLVPVYVDGTYKLMSKGHFFPKIGRITVRFGKPIVANKNKKQLTLLLEHCIKALKE